MKVNLTLILHCSLHPPPSSPTHPHSLEEKLLLSNNVLNSPNLHDTDDVT